MDVDNPSPEDAMETDPPPPPAPALHRKDSSIDPDGDEQMDAGEELYDEEGDIEFDEGEGDGHVDGDGDITPVDAEVEGEAYFEDENQDGEDAGVQDGEKVVDATDVQSTGAEEGQEEAAAEITGTEGGTVLTTAPAAEGITTIPAENTDGEVDAQQAEQGNIPVEPAAEAGNNINEEKASDEVPPETGDGAGEAEEDITQPAMAEEGRADAQHDGEHDEEGEEGYELLTHDTLPPILVHLPNAQRALFNPIVSEDGTSPPVWFAEKIQEFSEGTLTLLSSAIRGKLDEEGLGNEVDEMVITEKLTDLKMGDSDVNLEDVTFLDLVQMYHDCELPQPMELHIEFQPHRFITRYNAIQKELEAREVVYIEDDGGEEEHEGQEADAGDDEKHEGDQGEEPEEGDAELETDVAVSAGVGEIETGQAAVPLPEDGDAVDEGAQTTETDEHTISAAAETGVSDSQNGDFAPQQPAVGTQEHAPAETATVDEDTEQVNTAETAQADTTPLSIIPPAVPKTVSQVIAEDDPLVGTPEIRAADAHNSSSDSAAQPETIQIGDASTGADEGGSAEAAAEQVALVAEATGTHDAVETNGSAEPEADTAAEIERPAAQETEVDEAAAEGDDTAAAQQSSDQADQPPSEQVAESDEEEYAAEDEEQVEEAEEVEEYEEAEEEEEEGDDQDPYGVDKYVEGVDADAGDEAGADGANGEEVEEEYEEAEYDELAADASVDPSDPHGVDHEPTNGELHDEVTDETSPAKRSRSVDEEEAGGEEVVGKRAKLGESEPEAEAEASGEAR